jgi:hypothetical protein
MKSYLNEAGWDRGLRVVLGLILLGLGWGGAVDGALRLVLQIGGFLPLVTGLIGWCPAYALFGVSTRSAPSSPHVTAGPQ